MILLKKLTEITAVLLVAVLIISVFCSCSKKSDEDYSNSGYYNADQYRDDSEELSVEKLTNARGIFYGELNVSEQEIYEDIITQIINRKEEYVLSDCTQEEAQNAYDAIEREHPEFFWLANGNQITVTTSGETSEVTIRPHYYDTDFQEYMDMFDETVSKVISIAEQVSEDDLEIEKVLYVHDYLVENTEYDSASAYAIGSGESFLPATTAYGALINKSAVCSGYSAAFHMIMNMLGTECGRTTGEKIDGESHEWNYIAIDGEYYFVDVTWDDPVSDDLDEDNLSYEFFAITTDELLLTHIIDDNQLVPDCDGTEYDYYKMNNLYFDYYDFDSVALVIEEKASEGKVSIKFSTQEEADKAYKDLFDNKRIFSISNNDGFFGGSVQYSKGSSGLVINVYAE